MHCIKYHYYLIYSAVVSIKIIYILKIDWLYSSSCLELLVNPQITSRIKQPYFFNKEMTNMSEQVVTKQLVQKSKSLSYYVNSAIVFLIMLIVGKLPTFGQVTPMGMQVLGIFIGVNYGWCTVSMIWPSLIGFIAIGSVGYCTITEAFASVMVTACPCSWSSFMY